MSYEIGDTVVHWTHGLGRVIAIDEMDLAGITQQYYVVEVGPIKLWVPVKEANEGSIRFPAKSNQFMALFDILRNPGKVLSDNPYQRRIDLRERMQKRTLEGICHVIRDLSDRASRHTLNYEDSSILFRAEEHLVDEWALALGIERSNALQDLKILLQGNQPQIETTQPSTVSEER